VHCDLRPGQSVCFPLEYSGQVSNDAQGQAVNPTVTIAAGETRGNGRDEDGDDDHRGAGTGATPVFAPER
jgi:hypothetical protein